jgi:NAD(P)-dependent dehydrogenase (short-subunit alcohol dehydrogenase family)
VELSGAVVVVTGAARGIGAAIARAVARGGASGVLVADLDADGAEAVAEELRDAGCAALGRRVDVGDAGQVETMIATAEDELGPVDLVVSNAGILTGLGIEASPDDWDRAWRINVLAHVHAARAALPGMLERGRGAFVHTCSAAGLLTMVGDAPYTVSKHGAVAFAEWLSVTYGPRGIQVGALCPQGVETQLLSSGSGAVAEAAVRRAGAVLQPDEVADVVVEAVRDGRFLILPHPEVAEHLRRKGDDPQRWLAAMQRFAGEVEAGT